MKLKDPLNLLWEQEELPQKNFLFINVVTTFLGYFHEIHRG